MGRWWLAGVVGMLLAGGAAAAPDPLKCVPGFLQQDPTICDGKVPHATETACVRFTCVASSCEPEYAVVDGACVSRCHPVNGVQWCWDPDAPAGETCTTLCGDLKMSVSDDTAAFQAQDTPAECAAVRDAFGLPPTLTVSVDYYGYACIEYDALHFYCANNPYCPTAHRTFFDEGFFQVCPCVAP